MRFYANLTLPFVHSLLKNIRSTVFLIPLPLVVILAHAMAHAMRILAGTNDYFFFNFPFAFKHCVMMGSLYKFYHWALWLFVPSDLLYMEGYFSHGLSVRANALVYVVQFFFRQVQPLYYTVCYG